MATIRGNLYQTIKLYLPLGLEWGGLGVPTPRRPEFLFLIFYNILIFLKPVLLF